MSASNGSQYIKNFKFSRIRQNIKFFIFATCVLLVSCSSINLDDQTSNDDIGVAPIKDVKKEKNLKGEQSRRSKIIEVPISPMEYEKKKQIDEKMSIYKSYEPSIYFDYDDFKIKQKYQALIKITYELMKLDQQYNLIVEGHSDERGTTEYNLALGQKRAEAVARAMEQLGISRSRINSISFGEERPVGIGSSAEAWEKNRRADLTLK